MDKERKKWKMRERKKKRGKKIKKKDFFKNVGFLWKIFPKFKKKIILKILTRKNVTENCNLNKFQN